MPAPLAYALVALAGYLLGSIPVALLVGQARGLDLREVGDRNPGAWNAMEQLGTRAALPVFLGDAAKGAAAAGVGMLALGYWGAVVGAGAAMLGHSFPLFASFRGGRALMTYVGVCCVLTPLPAALALTVCAVASLARDFKLGVRLGVFLYPGLVLLIDRDLTDFLVAVGLLGIIALRFAQAWWALRMARQPGS